MMAQLVRCGVATFHMFTLGRQPGFLPGYTLAFTYQGYEGVEPRFANIEPIGNGAEGCRESQVHGVIHTLSTGGIEELDKHEGNSKAYQRGVCPM